MKTTLLLILLIVLCPLATAEQDVLEFLYEPALDNQQQNIATRIAVHARNAEFDAAISLSQLLLDDVEPLKESDPSRYGQVMINHGILRIAATEYELGLSIVERGMEFLEARTNPFSDVLINGVMAKGICQLELGVLDDAEDTFHRAQHIIHRQKGVYSEDQLSVVSYLTATNLRQRDAPAADLQQLFSLRVAEQAYGPDSIEILSTLNRLGSYFAVRGRTIPLLAIAELRLERDILFKNSISMYDRAIEIIEISYGENDLRLVPSLRGLASARMMQVTNRRAAEDALLRSITIVDSNPNSDLTDRAQALVDLGDLYIITSNGKAGETYLAAWALLQETPQTQQLASSLFDSPLRLFPRTSPVLYLDRIPDAAGPNDQLFIEIQYDVSPEGRALKIEVLDRNVPNEQVRMLRQTLRASRYRPRIIDGELVATEALQIYQSFQVVDETPLNEGKPETDETEPVEEEVPEISVDEA